MFEGLLSLYQQGLADVDRDYKLVRAAAPALIELETGILAESAGQKQPRMPGPLNLTPFASKVRSPYEDELVTPGDTIKTVRDAEPGWNLLATPAVAAEGDIFDALKTPAPGKVPDDDVAEEVAPRIQSRSTESTFKVSHPEHSIPLSVTLSSIDAKDDIAKALRASLPEGTIVHILPQQQQQHPATSFSTNAIVVPIVCELPSSLSLQAIANVRAMLQYDASTIFAEKVVNSAIGADGGEDAARAAMDVARCSGDVAVAIMVPAIESVEDFYHTGKDKEFIAALQAQLPLGTQVQISRVDVCSEGKGLVITAQVEGQPQEQKEVEGEVSPRLTQLLKEKMHSVLAPASFGKSKCLAIKEISPTCSPRSIAFSVALPSFTSAAEFAGSKQEAAMLYAVKSALPDGATVHITQCTPVVGGLLVAVAASLSPRHQSVGGDADLRDDVEQLKYLSTVLQHQPAQVFPPSIFQKVEVTMSTCHHKAQEDPHLAATGSLLAAACARLSTANSPRLGFSVYIPQSKDGDAMLEQKFISAVKKAAGESSHIQLCRSQPHGREGIVMSASVGGTPNVHDFQHRLLLSTMKPGSGIFDQREFGPTTVLASNVIMKAQPRVSAWYLLPPLPAGQARELRQAEVVSAVLSALPHGSKACISQMLPSPDGSVQVQVVADLACQDASRERLDASLSSVFVAGGSVQRIKEPVRGIQKTSTVAVMLPKGAAIERQSLCKELESSLPEGCEAYILDVEKTSDGCTKMDFAVRHAVNRATLIGQVHHAADELSGKLGQKVIVLSTVQTGPLSAAEAAEPAALRGSDLRSETISLAVKYKLYDNHAQYTPDDVAALVSEALSPVCQATVSIAGVCSIGDGALEVVVAASFADSSATQETLDKARETIVSHLEINQQDALKLELVESAVRLPRPQVMPAAGQECASVESEPAAMDDGSCQPTEPVNKNRFKSTGASTVTLMFPNQSALDQQMLVEVFERSFSLEAGSESVKVLHVGREAEEGGVKVSLSIPYEDEDSGSGSDVMRQRRARSAVDKLSQFVGHEVGLLSIIPSPPSDSKESCPDAAALQRDSASELAFTIHIDDMNDEEELIALVSKAVPAGVEIKVPETLQARDREGMELTLIATIPCAKEGMRALDVQRAVETALTTKKQTLKCELKQSDVWFPSFAAGERPTTLEVPAACQEAGLVQGIAIDVAAAPVSAGLHVFNEESRVQPHVVTAEPRTTIGKKLHQANIEGAATAGKSNSTVDTDIEEAVPAPLDSHSPRVSHEAVVGPAAQSPRLDSPSGLIAGYQRREASSDSPGLAAAVVHEEFAFDSLPATAGSAGQEAAREVRQQQQQQPAHYVLSTRAADITAKLADMELNGNDDMDLYFDPASVFAAGLDTSMILSVDWSTKTPQEIERRIIELLTGMDVLLSAPNAPAAEVAALQYCASQLPTWAAHKAQMELGFKLNGKQRYHEALMSFKASVAVQPNDPLAHFRIGNACFALRRYSEARLGYARALKQCKHGEDDALMPKVHVNMGITQEAEGLLMAACDHYKQATVLNPQHHRAYKLMGSAKYALGDFEGAKAALKQALILKADYADAHCDLGCTYCAQGEIEQAKQCFKAAIAANKNHLEAHFNMGNLYRQCAEFSRAIAAYDSALAIDASHWRSLLNKAVVQTCTGDKDNATFHLKLALKLSGQGSALSAEVEQLKKLLKAGAAWEVISGMMSYISDKAAQVETMATTDGSASMDAGGNKTGKSVSKAVGSFMSRGQSSKTGTTKVKAKLAKLGYDINAVVKMIDIPMLQQLQPFAGAKTANMLAEAIEKNCARGKKGKMIKVNKTEGLLRRLLSHTHSGIFQHMMRTFNSQVLAPLDLKKKEYVDLGVLLMVLVALPDEPSYDRANAAYQILQWRLNGEPVTRKDAFDYVATLKVIYGAAHDPQHWSARAPEPMDGQFVNVQRFVSLVMDAKIGFGLFEALPMMCKPLT